MKRWSKSQQYSAIKVFVDGQELDNLVSVSWRESLDERDQMNERPDIKQAKQALRIAAEEDKLRKELLKSLQTPHRRGAGFERDVSAVLDGIKDTLIEKNIAYGDSALNPLRVLSKASAEEQLRVRIDDKLSRLARGSDAGEDTIKDLIGYLVLLRIAQKRGSK